MTTLTFLGPRVVGTMPSHSSNSTGLQDGGVVGFEPPARLRVEEITDATAQDVGRVDPEDIPGVAVEVEVAPRPVLDEDPLRCAVEDLLQHPGRQPPGPGRASLI